jgi:hypothetical protein
MWPYPLFLSVAYNGKNVLAGICIFEPISSALKHQCAPL